MVRTLPIGLRVVLVPCVLIFIGAALAEDSPSPSATESPQASDPQRLALNDSLDAYAVSMGIARVQDPQPSITPEGSTVAEPENMAVSSLFDASALAATPPPNIGPRPIAPQHVAVSSYVDADSLGNRTVYADGTVAPFSGIYETGFRFRVMGDASWYRFVASDNPRTLGAGRYLEGDVLAGYGIWLPRFDITGLVGPAFVDMVNQGLVTERWGARAAIEIDGKPTDWTIASGSVSYTTPTNYLQAQAKVGVKIFEGVYFGPESKLAWQQLIPFQISFFTPAVVTTTRVPAQTTIAYVHVGAFLAVNFGPVAIGVSGGWAEQQGLGPGFYGSASLYVPL